MKIQDQSVLKVLAVTFICLLLYSIFMVKLFGSTEVTIDVEKNGYCKQYGESWYNPRGKNICNDEYSNKQVVFTEQEFNSYCLDNKFLSTKFYSDCFLKSGSIV